MHALMMHIDVFITGAPDPPIITGNNTATEFDVHQLTCDANNGLPSSQILWFLKDTDITGSSVQTNTDNADFRVDSRSVLNYTMERDANGEDIRCEVRHQNLQGPTFPEDSITMNVKCKCVIE